MEREKAMSKALLMASMAAMIIIPLRAARLKNPLAGLRRAMTGALAFNLIWAVVVLSIFLFLLHTDVTKLYPHSVKQ
jgi:hypothetical protein